MSMTKYPPSYQRRIGEQMLRKRAPLQPSELSEADILRGLLRSERAAETLLAEYGSLKNVAATGSKRGFAVMAGLPGITPHVIAALECWLESIGRITAR